MALPERWISVDPGEDTGWAVWSGDEFVDHGTTKMWDFSDAIWAEVMRQIGAPVAELEFMAIEPDAKLLQGLSFMVVENWSLYPKVLRTGALDWDECRTARLIGSLFQACRFANWGYEQQGAFIKEAAVAAGAETYFSKPLRENRHANDATMHGVYRIAKEAAS